MSDELMKVIIGISAIFLFVVIMSGCSKFEEQLRCSPVDSQECVGWLGDKPIIIEEDL